MMQSAQELIKQNHGRTLEFAALEKRTEPWLRTAVAFANCAGGVILFGVNPVTKIPEGVDDSAALRTMDAVREALSDACSPELTAGIFIETVDGKTLIRLEIAEGRQKPYFIKTEGSLQGIYVRAGSLTRNAEPYEFKDLLCAGRGPAEGLSLRGEEAKDVEALCRRLTVRTRELSSENKEGTASAVTPEDLSACGLISESGGKLFAAPAFELLAASDHDRTQTYIRCAVFGATTRARILSMKECTGPIDEQVEAAAAFVMTNLRLGVRIEHLYREEFPELPFDVVRELIAAAAVQMPFTAHRPLEVCLYENRFEVVIPGILPSGLTFDLMEEGFTRPRNRPLAALFRRIGLMKSWGNALPLINKVCRDWHLGEPVLREMSDRTVIAVPRRPFATDAYGALPHTLTASDPEVPDPLKEKLMAFLRDTPQATQSEAAKALGASVITVKRLFAVLQKEKRLRRIGNNRRGLWQVL